MKVLYLSRGAWGSGLWLPTLIRSPLVPASRVKSLGVILHSGSMSSGCPQSKRHWVGLNHGQDHFCPSPGLVIFAPPWNKGPAGLTRISQGLQNKAVSRFSAEMADIQSILASPVDSTRLWCYYSIPDTSLKVFIWASFTGQSTLLLLKLV